MNSMTLHRMPAVLLLAGVLSALLSPAHAATPAKPSADAQRMYVHEARNGDTLLGLAARYLIKPGDWQKLEKLNQIANPRRIPVGTKVRIPVDLMRTEQAPATVLRTTGKAELGGAALAPNTVLKEGDTVRTGEDGFVTLKLADGSTIALQSRSQLKVKTTRQLVNTGGVGDTQLRLDAGRLETRVAAQRGPAARYEIETPTSNMGVRGTVFRVGSDGAAKSQGEVTEGRVAADSTDPKFPGTVAVSAGFGTIVEAGKPPSPPVQLLEPPVLRQREISSDSPEVGVAFAAVAQAQSYRGQVALDDAFTQLVADVPTRTPEVQFRDLPDGTLFMRVRAVDAQGLEGRDAQGTLTVKARPRAPSLEAPDAGARLAAAPAALRWSPSGEAAGYRVQLASVREPGPAPDTPFVAPSIDKPAGAGAEFKLEGGLAPGRWTWRVASIDAKGKQGPWTPPRAFDVQPPQLVFKPYPARSGRLIGIGDEKQKYQVQAARDERFTRIVADRVVDGQVDFSGLPVNGYYVRARLSAGGAPASDWSPAWYLEVYPGGWQLNAFAPARR
ncbi:MAG: FecR domain-containing protein [Betaproteobacteria bacterium]|nr:FecR domain-containing protein [Betaproteobacteria bacterium]